MTDYRDRERDRDKRPSWKEIDRRKDKSSHVSVEMERKERKKITTGYSRYKDHLDRLFMTGEKSDIVKGILDSKAGKSLGHAEAPERQKLLRAIREALLEREIEEKVDEFTRKYGDLPDDIEVLTQSLLHPDDAVKEKVLEKISRHLDGHLIEKKSLLIERVKNLAANSEEDAVIDLAREVKKKLGR